MATTVPGGRYKTVAGWVDANGNLLEAETPAASPVSPAPPAPPPPVVVEAPVELPPEQVDAEAAIVEPEPEPEPAEVAPPAKATSSSTRSRK